MLMYEKKRHVLTVKLEDELDHRMAARIRGEIDALIGDTSVRRLVLDLADLAFMDSSGIGLIIGRYKVMQKKGGSMAVKSPSAQMDRIFEMAGLYRIVERMA